MVALGHNELKEILKLIMEQFLKLPYLDREQSHVIGMEPIFANVLYFSLFLLNFALLTLCR